jgi:putative hydrolase of the HAD superfamily
VITTIFWDIGGVLLTNGWDRAARRRAVSRFEMEWDAFEDRHEQVAGVFETGRIDLDTYLDRTVFHVPRRFDRPSFKAFMFEQSQACPDALELVRSLRRAGAPRMAALNNESRELNLYRIERFGLRQCFSLFFSSCFVGLRKPEEALFRMVLQVTQTPAESALLVDDREINVEAASCVGMQAIRYEGVESLRGSLQNAGVLPVPGGHSPG